MIELPPIAIEDIPEYDVFGSKAWSPNRKHFVFFGRLCGDQGEDGKPDNKLVLSINGKLSPLMEMKCRVFSAKIFDNGFTAVDLVHHNKARDSELLILDPHGQVVQSIDGMIFLRDRVIDDAGRIILPPST